MSRHSHHAARLGLAALALGLCLATAACGGGGDDAALKPADVQRFVQVKEATDTLTRLLQATATADDSANQLAQKQPGTGEAKRMVEGTRVGWNNVLVGLNAFTPAQAGTVHSLTGAIQTTRAIAITWLNTMDDLEHAPPATRHAMVVKMAVARKQELKGRDGLQLLAVELAKMTCTLERAHAELAPAGAAQTDCQNAGRLALSVG